MKLTRDNERTLVSLEVHTGINDLVARIERLEAWADEREEGGWAEVLRDLRDELARLRDETTERLRAV